MNSRSLRKNLGLMRTVLVLAVGFASGVAPAWTYVGNGGNSGDLEIAVTKVEIEKALTRLPDEKNLCTCDERMGEHPLCDILKSLTSEQRTFCEQFLRDHAKDLMSVMNSPRMEIEYTHEAISLEEGLGLRAAEAHASAAQMKITLNQERFVGMHSYERVFLLTHEFGHFVEIKSGDRSHPIDDKEMIGPFDSNDGGKRLLNAVGAAVSVVAVQSNITDEYLSVINRSRGGSRNWLYLDLASAQPNGEDSPWKSKSLSGGTFGYRYQLTPEWGLLAEIRQLNNASGVLKSVSLNEDQTAYGLGLAYRYFPVSDIMSYWGPSHFVISAKVEEVFGHIKIADPYTSAEDSERAMAGEFDCDFFIPGKSGFWFYAGLGYNSLNFKYQTDGGPIHNNRGQVLGNLGVSYGFR